MVAQQGFVLGPAHRELGRSGAQQELAARYARAVGARNTFFMYAGHVDEAVERLRRAGVVGEQGRLLDIVGGRGLRVADVRTAAAEAHEAGALLLVDNTVPSSFGCAPFELGANVSLEALDRVAAGKLSRKVVAVASCVPLACAGDEPVGGLGDVLAEEDLDAIDAGLDTLPERMQRHFDHARALAEYLACCEGPVSVSYPGLSAHPDHDLATRILRHGFGPAVDIELDPSAGMTAGAFIDACRLNGREHPAGGFHTRFSARDGADGFAVRIFAGLDNPLDIAADLDRVLRSLK